MMMQLSFQKLQSFYQYYVGFSVNSINAYFKWECTLFPKSHVKAVYTMQFQNVFFQARLSIATQRGGMNY